MTLIPTHHVLKPATLSLCEREVSKITLKPGSLYVALAYNELRAVLAEALLPLKEHEFLPPNYALL